MSKRKDMLLMAAGILIGVALPPGTAQAVSEYIQAQRSPCAVYVDGQKIELDAYLIHGNNYVQLRDIGKAVGFNVYWDGAVQIESGQPYTGEPPTQEKATSETDYAQAANPAVFTECLTAEVYDTIREAVATGEPTSFGSAVTGFIGLKYGDDETLFKRAETETRQISSALSSIGLYPSYGLASSDTSDEYLCEIKYPEVFAPAVEHTKDFIDGLNGLPEREKIKRIAWYVCDRIAYDKTRYAWPNETLTQDGVTRGACMSYAYSFQFLCQQAGIPCILVVSDIHEWNMVYAEGRWWEVDVTANDCDTVSFQTVGPHGEHSEETIIAFDGTDEFRENYYVTADRVLWDRDTEQYLGSDYTDIQPEVTEFAKEVLVPGSIK